MINGAHVIIQSKDAEADRAFIKDVLKFKYVDVNHGYSHSAVSGTCLPAMGTTTVWPPDTVE